MYDLLLNMQKTNIRLNNFFILENKSKYFLTDIDQLEDWKDFQSKKRPYNNK